MKNYLMWDNRITHLHQITWILELTSMEKNRAKEVKKYINIPGKNV